MPEATPSCDTSASPASQPDHLLRLEQELFSLIAKNVLNLPGGFDFESDLARAGLDSMALMQLLILIENNFGLVISEADLSRERFTSIHSLASLISERLPVSKPC